MGTKKSITTEALIGKIAEITAFVDAELEAAGCPLKQQMQIDVAVDELVSNVARYAYGCGTGKITVEFEFDEGSRLAALTFIDEGIPYDPTKKEEPDVTLPVEQREIGGLGIFLVARTMDAMKYRREAGRNILRIEKKI